MKILCMCYVRLFKCNIWIKHDGWVNLRCCNVRLKHIAYQMHLNFILFLQIIGAPRFLPLPRILIFPFLFWLIHQELQLFSLCEKGPWRIWLSFHPVKTSHHDVQCAWWHFSGRFHTSNRPVYVVGIFLYIGQKSVCHCNIHQEHKINNFRSSYSLVQKLVEPAWWARMWTILLCFPISVSNVIIS
jgi:hypothetical protein